VAVEKTARRTVEAPGGLAEAVERAARGKERVVVTRAGQEVAVIVPVSDLDGLEDLEARREAARRRLGEVVGRIQADSVARGLDKITDEEIQAEIKAVRDERRARSAKAPDSGGR
jgi:prevent-host-death family protein